MNIFEKMSDQEVGRMYRLYNLLEEANVKNVCNVKCEEFDGYFTVVVGHRKISEVFANIHRIKPNENGSGYILHVVLFSGIHDKEFELEVESQSLLFDSIVKEMERFHREVESRVTIQDIIDQLMKVENKELPLYVDNIVTGEVEKVVGLGLFNEDEKHSSNNMLRVIFECDY